MYQNFTYFTPIPYLQEYPLYNEPTARFPTIFDSFRLNVDFTRQASKGVGDRGPEVSKSLFKKIKEEGVGMNYVIGQVMGHSGLKTG